MSPTFSDDDVGKRIENVEGEAIGRVTAVEEDVAYGETDPGVTDSIKATLGWETDRDEIVSIRADDVSEVTDEAIRLEASGGLHDEGEEREGAHHGDVVERHEDADERNVGASESENAGIREADYGDAKVRSGDERHPDDAEAPPEGDDTVTKRRGEKEGR
ncbi:hypothetical protein ACFQGT_14015 [Natrialbaceae archaeon GCM10025810]|uniref:hypothetical protein n=1 Tax=Halovalidus salilacus TaxID=3075124 RepID=UPI00361EB9A9